MAVTFVGASSAHSGGTFSVPRPVGSQNGDFLICALASTSSVPLTSLAGWSGNWSGNWYANFGMTISTKTVEQADPSSYQVVVSGASVVTATILCYRGVDAISPLASGIASTSVESRYHYQPSVTTDTADSVLLLWYVLNSNAPNTATTGFTQRESANAWPVYRTFLDRPQPAQGDSGGIFLDLGASTQGLSIVTALRPAGDGPPPVTAKPWSYAQVIE